MSETAQAWLRNTTKFWTPSVTEFDGARSHRAAIESRLDLDLGVHRMGEIGSLLHGTGIWLYSGADFLVSLGGAQPISPSTTLGTVKRSLQSRFPTATIEVRRPAVVCHFSDGDVEVVPGFFTDGGYSIPDPNGGWMLIHPSDHSDWVNEVDRRVDGAAKELARQVKIWKYKRKVPISSCYLEMQASKHLNVATECSPLQDLHLTLHKMQVAELAAMDDPMGLNSRFTATSSETNRTDALCKLSTAVSRASNAEAYEASGDQNNAITQLKLLFNL